MFSSKQTEIQNPLFSAGPASMPARFSTTGAALRVNARPRRSLRNGGGMCNEIRSADEQQNISR